MRNETGKEISDKLINLYYTLKMNEDQKFLEDSIQEYEENPEMAYALILEKRGKN